MVYPPRTTFNCCCHCRRILSFCRRTLSFCRRTLRVAAAEVGHCYFSCCYYCRRALSFRRRHINALCRVLRRRLVGSVLSRLLAGNMVTLSWLRMRSLAGKFVRLMNRLANLTYRTIHTSCNTGMSLCIIINRHIFVLPVMSQHNRKMFRFFFVSIFAIGTNAAQQY